MGPKEAEAHAKQVLFHIYEGDLAKLERALPKLCDAAGMALNKPQNQVLFEECKDIISNVRWNYGPPQEVRIMSGPPDGLIDDNEQP